MSLTKLKILQIHESQLNLAVYKCIILCQLQEAVFRDERVQAAVLAKPALHRVNAFVAHFGGDQAQTLQRLVLGET